MTCIFYGPGMFGSTLEYVLSNIQQQKPLSKDAICEDGSLHSFEKAAHIWEESAIKYVDTLSAWQIATIIYPNQTLEFPEIIERMPNQMPLKNILIYSPRRNTSELNLLFQYYKISTGQAGRHRSQGLSNFTNHGSLDYQNWNSNYTSWDDMQTWEWREWFSFYYPGLISQWETSERQAPAKWLRISNMSILDDFEYAVWRMINHINIPVTDEQQNNLIDFALAWTQKQQYIVDEWRTINAILRSIDEDFYYSWQPLCVISEAIVQNRLRQRHIEIQCQDLNQFPTNTNDLQKLLKHVIV